MPVFAKQKLARLVFAGWVLMLSLIGFSVVRAAFGQEYKAGDEVGVNLVCVDERDAATAFKMVVDGDWDALAEYLKHPDNTCGWLQVTVPSIVIGKVAEVEKNGVLSRLWRIQARDNASQRGFAWTVRRADGA